MKKEVCWLNLIGRPSWTIVHKLRDENTKLKEEIRKLKAERK